MSDKEDELVVDTAAIGEKPLEVEEEAEEGADNPVQEEADENPEEDDVGNEDEPVEITPEIDAPVDIENGGELPVEPIDLADIPADDIDIEVNNTSCFEKLGKQFNVFISYLFFGLTGWDAPREYFGLYLMFLGSLQQLSLLILNTLDFSIWGEVFEYINVLTLNVNLDLGGLEGEVAYLTFVFLLPVILCVDWVIIDDLLGGYPDEFKTTWRFSIIIEIFLVIAGIVLMVLQSPEAGAILFIPVGLILFVQGATKFKKWYIKKTFDAEFSKEQNHWKDRFLLLDVISVDVILFIWFPIVVTAWTNVALLNDDETVAVIGGVVGGLVIAFLMARELFKLANEYRIDRKIYEKGEILLTLGMKRYLRNNGTQSNFKKKYFALPVIFMLEKLVLASIPNIVASNAENEEDAEIVQYVFIGLLTIPLVFFTIFEPHEEKLYFRADFISRVSNLVIFIFAIAITRVNEDEVDDEVTPAETYFSVLMFLISGYMLFYWIYSLKVKTFMKEKLLSLYAIYQWRNVNTVEQAGAIILGRQNQAMTKIEAESISHIKRICAYCVKRTRTFADEELAERTMHEDQLDIEFNLRYTRGIDESALFKYGFWGIEGVKKFNLESYENSIADFEVIVNSGVFGDLVERGMTSFCLADRDLNTEQIKTYMDELVKQPLTHVHLNDLVGYGSEEALAMVEKIPSLTSVQKLEMTRFTFEDDNANLLIDAVFELPNLTDLTLNYCSLKDGNVEYFATCVEEKEHKLERAILRDNDCEKLETVDIFARAALESATLRTIDLSDYSRMKCKMHLAQIDYPDLFFPIPYPGYVQHDKNRGEKCNVCIVQTDNDRETEVLEEGGFTEDYCDILTRSGSAASIVPALHFMTEKWQDIARSKINEKVKIENYDFASGEMVEKQVTLGDLFIEADVDADIMVLLFNFLEEWGFDFSVTVYGSEDTFIDYAEKHEDKKLKGWAMLKKGMTNAEIVTELRKIERRDTL